MPNRKMTAATVAAKTAMRVRNVSYRIARFRACLKLADTSVSNMVGKLFFNVVQTKCFVLKPIKACKQRSWWGKCLRKGYMRQAFLRDNLPY